MPVKHGPDIYNIYFKLYFYNILSLPSLSASHILLTVQSHILVVDDASVSIVEDALSSGSIGDKGEASFCGGGLKFIIYTHNILTKVISFHHLPQFFKRLIMPSNLTLFPPLSNSLSPNNSLGTAANNVPLWVTKHQLFAETYLTSNCSFMISILSIGGSVSCLCGTLGSFFAYF